MLTKERLIQYFSSSEAFRALDHYLSGEGPSAASATGMTGSAQALAAAASIGRSEKSFLFVWPDKEAAAYFFNDLENLLGEAGESYEERSSFFFPSSYKKPLQSKELDKTGIQLRAEVLNRLAESDERSFIITYPEAMVEKVLSRSELKKNILRMHQGDRLSLEFLTDMLYEYGFERVDFVAEPGQFSVRGGILDVFSFSNDNPFRIELFNDTVESLRTFDPATQLSLQKKTTISVLPDIQAMGHLEAEKKNILYSLPKNSLVWLYDGNSLLDMSEKLCSGGLHPSGIMTEAGSLEESLRAFRILETQRVCFAKGGAGLFVFDHAPQPSFNKQFDLLIDSLKKHSRLGYENIIFFDTQKQAQRIKSIFDTLGDNNSGPYPYHPILMSLHEGFIDHDNRIACFTDHQIFGRYHRFRIRDKFKGRYAMNLQTLYNLKPGDYVTHIDHGVGIFSGLEKIEIMGREQEAIRLVYKNNDILYVSIHSLHRIARYAGREGSTPSLNRLGSSTWSNLKRKTKKKVKDIAQDLIHLYAKRKAQKGFAFSPDTYLQHELEASFLFEDTPDQEKATQAVKKDMEASIPMDRLICGDVGFGKTEVAIRAAFKAATDSKQVAVLVPTTILALQHYYTFRERLADFPCNVDYISRFRTAREQKKVLAALREGHIDILIGTHRLLGRDVGFKDMGLLIIDEEQKFGVAAKEKLKRLRVHVDTLTLTATPIPRTLQFSLLGARDLSYLNTPPQNRYPILTEVHVFNTDLIKEAIDYEISRGGQVFFVHNRVQNIEEVAAIVQRACPDARIAVGHGQLDGSKLERIMVDFIHGEYDVLVSTSIIESGLDIPNANTIVINNAHHFGLSDLHQMRGRVGRTNRKAYCYLLSPPLSTLTDEARRRLRSIEEFSDLGSGFSIAMRDLDIRGAGNLLGAEQSGFISEIGLQTYHKILDEAVQELREEEFKGLFSEEDEGKKRDRHLADCHLETDLELMIPSDYISNIEERLRLYKELDGIEEEAGLNRFAGALRDRFGPLPHQAEGLLEAVRLRWSACESGFEKVILKSGKLIAHMPDSEKTSYYDSEVFGNILQFVQRHPRRSRIRETGRHLVLTIEQVESIRDGRELITALSGPPGYHS